MGSNREKAELSAKKNILGAYVAQKLLSQGHFELTEEFEIIRISRLNALLDPLNFKAVLWPGTADLYLVDKDRNSGEDFYNDRKYKIIAPWTDRMTLKAQNTFEQLATNQPTDSWENIRFLGDLGYIEKKDNRIRLTRRALLNYSEFFLEKNPGKFRECPVCRNIVMDKEKHGHCTRITQTQQQ